MPGNVETTISDFGSWLPTNYRYVKFQLTDHGINSPYGSPLGGDCVELIASQTLLVGDVIQMFTTNYQVQKSVATLNKTIGVVVGGQRTPHSGKAGVITNPKLYGVQQAALVNQVVLVQVFGIVQVVSDGALVITAGDGIIPSAATAGQVTRGTASVTINAGATAVTSTAANGAIIGGNGFAVPFIGVAVTNAAAVAGTVFTILLQIL